MFGSWKESVWCWAADMVVRIQMLEVTGARLWSTLGGFQATLIYSSSPPVKGCASVLLAERSTAKFREPAIGRSDLSPGDS
jgi:hypothetical protein